MLLPVLHADHSESVTQTFSLPPMPYSAADVVDGFLFSWLFSCTRRLLSGLLTNACKTWRSFDIDA